MVHQRCRLDRFVALRTRPPIWIINFWPAHVRQSVAQADLNAKFIIFNTKFIPIPSLRRARQPCAYHRHTCRRHRVYAPSSSGEQRLDAQVSSGEQRLPARGTTLVHPALRFVRGRPLPVRSFLNSAELIACAAVSAAILSETIVGMIVGRPSSSLPLTEAMPLRAWISLSYLLRGKYT